MKSKIRNAKRGAPGEPIKRNKFICFLLIVLIICTQTACWDRVEVEQLAIVTLVALDKAENGDIRVTLQIINPKATAGGGGNMISSSSGSPSEPYHNITASGETIFGAIRTMNSSIPRELYFSHNQVVIISEEVAGDGIEDLMDFFDRNPQIRRSNYILITDKETDLNKVLNIPHPLDPSVAQRITGIIKEQDRNPQYAVNQLGDFLELLSGKGVDAFTAGLDLSVNESDIQALSQQAQTDGGQNKVEEINIARTAVFKKGKMVGWLNKEESRGLLWIREGLKGGIYNVAVDDAVGDIALEVIKGVSKQKTQIASDGRIIINIDVEVEANVDEVRTYLDLTKSENISKLENALQKAIKRDIMLVLDKAQQRYGADVFGFGQSVYRQYPDYWRQISDKWDEIYPTVETVINVKAVVPRTGLVSKPIKAATV